MSGETPFVELQNDTFSLTFHTTFTYVNKVVSTISFMTNYKGDLWYIGRVKLTTRQLLR